MDGMKILAAVVALSMMGLLPMPALALSQLPTLAPLATPDAKEGKGPGQTSTLVPMPTPEPTLPPTPPPAPTATQDPAALYPTLRKGDRGDAVVRLQRQLQGLGYLSGAADGDFGPKTENAVKAAQRDAGLSQSGVATPEFQAWLFGQSAPAARGTVIATGDVYLWRRASDSDSGDKICVAYEGTRLGWDGEQRSGTYNGKSVTWYHVQYPDVTWYKVKVDGVTGWICDIYVAEQSDGTVRVFANAMQLRGSPSLDGRRLDAYVNKGERISVSDAERSVEKGPIGWVPSRYARVSG